MSRVYRKKIELEIKRLEYILNNMCCDEDEKIYINNTIQYLKNEIGFIR